MIEKFKVNLEKYSLQHEVDSNEWVIPSSVIVLIYSKNNTYNILLNKRTYSVKDHKGEISFPGGRQNKNDNSLLTTALREFEEEMGVPQTKIDIIGRLSNVITSTNYSITPYLATTSSHLDFSPNPKEVALLIEIPINELKKPENLRSEIHVSNNTFQKYICYSYEGNYIWGATARILTELLYIYD